MSEQIQGIELSIETAKEMLKRCNNEVKLAENAQFKDVIIEGYLKEEAARLASMLAEPQMQDEINQRELYSAIKAIGHLRQYLINIRMTGERLKADILDGEETVQMLLDEASEDTE